MPSIFLANELFISQLNGPDFIAWYAMLMSMKVFKKMDMQMRFYTVSAQLIETSLNSLANGKLCELHPYETICLQNFQ
jgi:hypothetical protein